MTTIRIPPACPICGDPRSESHRPFCSTRCADADLQRWLSGRYFIPVGEDEERRETGVFDPVPGQAGRGHL